MCRAPSDCTYREPDECKNYSAFFLAAVVVFLPAVVFFDGLLDLFDHFFLVIGLDDVLIAAAHAFAQVLDGLADGAAELREVLGPKMSRITARMMRSSGIPIPRIFIRSSKLLVRSASATSLPLTQPRVTCLCKKGMFPIPFSNQITAFAATVMIAQC